jgi:putative effector of murein hydrolase LrgA (UPF0299 family)
MTRNHQALFLIPGAVLMVQCVEMTEAAVVAVAVIEAASTIVVADRNFLLPALTMTPP